LGTISRKGAERLKRQLIRAETGKVNNPPIPASPGGPIGYGLFFKSSGSGVGAASSVTQMTSGTVAIWTFGPTGAGVDTGETTTVWNKATTAVPANTHGIAIMTCCGWTIDWWACA